MDRSSPTISQVYRFDTLENYLAYHKERQNKHKEPVAPVQSPAHNEDLSLLFDKLAAINDKLDMLIEAEQERQDHAKVNRWKFGGSK